MKLRIRRRRWWWCYNFVQQLVECQRLLLIYKLYMTMTKHFRISLLGASMSYVETTKALIERRSLEDHTTGTNRQLFTYHHHLKTTADWGTSSTVENCWSPLQQLAKYFQRLQVSWDESNKKSEKKARIKSTAPAIEDALLITSSVVVSHTSTTFLFLFLFLSK